MLAVAARDARGPDLAASELLGRDRCARSSGDTGPTRWVPQFDAKTRLTWHYLTTTPRLVRPCAPRDSAPARSYHPTGTPPRGPTWAPVGRTPTATRQRRSLAGSSGLRPGFRPWVPICPPNDTASAIARKSPNVGACKPRKRRAGIHTSGRSWPDPRGCAGRCRRLRGGSGPARSHRCGRGQGDGRSVHVRLCGRVAEA